MFGTPLSISNKPNQEPRRKWAYKCDQVKHTFMSFELVNMQAFIQVSRKSTWSLSSWSTVVTFSNFASRECQFGSRTSNVMNASTCWTKANILARRRHTRSRHPTNSEWLGTEHRHGCVFCSTHMFERACSTCLRWRRKRKISWYKRIVLREMTSDRGNLTL